MIKWLLHNKIYNTKIGDFDYWLMLRYKKELKIKIEKLKKLMKVDCEFNSNKKKLKDKLNEW